MAEQNKQDATTTVQHHKHARSILLIVLVLLIAMIAALVYALNERDTDNEPAQSQSALDEPSSENLPQPLATEDRAQSEPVDTVSSWVTATTDDFSIKIPDGWGVVQQDNGVILMSCNGEVDCYKVIPGTPADITQVQGGRDGFIGFLFAIQPPGFSINDLGNTYSENGTVGNGDEAFIGYEYTETKEPTGDFIGELPKGTLSRVFLRELPDGRVAYMSYDVLPGQDNPFATMAEILESFEHSQ